MEDAAEHRAELGAVPAVVSPGCFVLVAPVSIIAAIEPGKLGQEHRAGVLAKVLGFFDVVIVEAVTIDRLLPAGPILRMKRRFYARSVQFRYKI